ncbi:ABC transporter substrate-binding protein [Pseudoroseicyclus tamaricis]|uniref:Carbohydrate ABC transporter substrate-binding protein n=1 Tax=Pseudoroseicyclus tamaricis TaxID=2705421 RepID=A0A6B2JHE7_9RHOB|nr:ABC transporter substrate-binding protein [Pseudoroseicyclus tamaricis]NDV00663.1 carbohydrate ABC transporter substrate-binding protein [Pseudoroseicyclus tamaricis]
MNKMLCASVATLALTAGAVSAQDLMFEPGSGEFNWDSYDEFAANYDFEGEQVTIFGPWLAGEQQAFEGLVAYFNEATGANATYVGSDSLEQQIVIDAEAGSPPNITFFPQPGLASNMAERGFLTPLPDGTAEWVTENYAAGQSWVDLGTYAGPDGEEDLYTFFFNVNVKSLVWYVPENFEDLGYEVPETMEDLKALTQQMVEDGVTPWCIGLGSGSATGWPATDWVEDLMLRTQTPEVYDQWVTNEIPFDDERVVGAIEEFGWFLQDDYVAGGSGAVAATDFRDSPAGLFDAPPQCMMHRQASFIPSYFPEGTELGVDADFFYFPAYAEKDLGAPVLGAGTLAGITEDSEAAQGFIEFLKTPLAHEVMMAQPGFLTPLTSANPETYIDDTQRALGEILTNATTFRFDGSDLMPGAIGAGAFWTAMVDYAGGADAQSVAEDVQSAWDSLN